MSEHTPGPWLIKKRNDKTYSTHDGNLVVMDARSFFIASIHADADENEVVSTTEQMANARLIAQAPRMEDLLEEILQEFEDRFDGAPDAKMQWMGHLMFEINRTLADIKNQRFP